MKNTDKLLTETFRYIDNTSKTQNFKVKVGRTKNHAYNNRELTFSKTEDKYSFSITTLIRRGVQTDKELEINKETEVQLRNDERIIFSKGKYIIPSSISYPDLDSLSLEKLVKGGINAISSKPFSFYNKQRCFRIILPLNRPIRLRGSFTGWNYTVDGKPQYETLIKLTINNREFHFFSYLASDKKSYIIIDSIGKHILEDFKKIANSILLAYGFLKGEYHGKEGFIFTYNSNNFDVPVSMLSIILGGGIYNGFPVHSASPHSLIIIKNRTKYKKDKEGKIIGIDDSDLRKYMEEFPHESLSKLCELICNKGGVLRAVILFISNHSATLELKIPTLFVALENITKVLIGGDVFVPKLIENVTIIKEIKAIVKTAVKQIGEVERNNIIPILTTEELTEYKATFARIIGKFNDYNKGTNNKKLIEPFTKFGYILTQEEKDLIFKHRNKFLHGDDYMSLEEDYEFEFKELFHMSMRLQKMIAVLLLKASGYSGYILNNAKIYDYISERTIKEDIFVMI